MKELTGKTNPYTWIKIYRNGILYKEIQTDRFGYWKYNVPKTGNYTIK